MIKKLRQCFIWELQYFMVETLMNVDGTPSILRIETSKEAEDIKIPPFVTVMREVTEDSHYETRTMAAQAYNMPEEDKIKIDALLAEQSQRQ